MKKVNGLTVFEGTDICSLDEYSERMAEDIPKVINNSDIKNQIDLVADMIPTLESEEAENINVDSSKYYGQVKVRGKSEQETRSGKNFFDVSKDLTSANTDYEYTHLDNGYRIKLTQATSEARYMVYSGQIHLEPGQYIFSCLLTVSGGTRSNRGRVRIYNSSGTIIYPTSSNVDCSDELKYASFNIEVATDITIAFYYVSNSDVETTENANIYCEWKNIQIEKSSDTQPTEYEDYGASPSSEYPSEIKNLSGDIEITVCNKNFVKLMPEISKDYITINNNQTFIINGTLNQNDNFKFVDGIFLKPGKYRASLGIDYTKFNDSYFNVSANGQQTKYYNRADATFEIGVDAIVDLSMVLIAGTYNNLIVKPMIERTDGEITSNWVEHEEQKITFPLSEGQKMYDGDYLADDGIHHVRKQITLDGTDNISYSISGTVSDRFSLSTDRKPTDQTEMLCSHFVCKAGVGITSENKICYTNNSNIYIEVLRTITGITESDNSSQKVTKLNNYILQQNQAGKPIVIEYELAEEETDPYTEAQQEAHDKSNKIMTYYPVTNVYSNQGAKSQLIYKMNLNSMFATVQKAIVEGGNQNV